jgi:hypothetical protein
MKEGDYVRLEKIGSTPNGLPACPMSWYSPGAFTGFLSLPERYWIEGVLEENPRIGGRILLSRYVRFGVASRGCFRSSLICSIQGDRITTFNSVWRVLRVPPLDPNQVEETQS